MLTSKVNSPCVTPCVLPHAVVQQWCAGAQRVYLLLLQ